MHILIFSKESRGGTGELLQQLSQLKNHGFTISYFLYKKDLISPIRNKCHFINQSYPETREASLKKVKIFFRNIFKTKRILVRTKYDVVLTCDHYSAIQILLLKLSGVVRFPKKVYILENNNLQKVISQKPFFLYRFLLGYISKLLYKSADKIITTNSRLSEAVSTFFGYPKNSVVCIPGGINHSTANRKKKERFIMPDAYKENKNLKIITVGRLEKQKDFDMILRSFALAMTQVKKKEISLFIVGDGSEKERLKKMAIQLKIDSSVHFLGWQKNIYPFLAKSDIFLFASTHEGFGMVIIEAMAMGLPVICTNTPFGPSEILDKGKYGALVPMHDYKKMALLLTSFIRSKALREDYAKKAKKRSFLYSERIMLQRFEKLFKDTHI